MHQQINAVAVQDACGRALRIACGAASRIPPAWRTCPPRSPRWICAALHSKSQHGEHHCKISRFSMLCPSDHYAWQQTHSRCCTCSTTTVPSPRLVVQCSAFRFIHDSAPWWPATAILLRTAGLPVLLLHFLKSETSCVANPTHCPPTLHCA